VSKKNSRALWAEETLAIIEKGYYTVDDKIISVKGIVSDSISKSELYKPDGFADVLSEAEVKIQSLSFDTEIIVQNSTVLKAASTMAQSGEIIGCLNFASAKNPGGGFLGGALAQEESLAVSSSLYPTLMKHQEMYHYNRLQHTYLYSDYMIYSPNVIVFRNDAGELLETPYQLSIITSPAVNIGAIKNNKPSELEQVQQTMLQRMDKMFALFVHHDIQHLLLGAWGCGVFQNNPADIASYFAYYLINGKYARCFKQIVFAVYDRSKGGDNINAFQEQFDTHERQTTKKY
jgi:uncharacterized protein (TIGR02452 family)